jgi:hypothetical protein
VAGNDAADPYFRPVGAAPRGAVAWQVYSSSRLKFLGGSWHVSPR